MTTTMTKTRDVSRPEFIALIAGLMALNALAIDVMLPALPYMGEALNVATENDRHYVLTAYMLGFGIAQLAFGPLSDRYGRRAPLLVGLAVYVVAAFAAVFSPTFSTLLVLRFVQGMGEALNVATENDRHYVLTAYMLGFGIAQLAFGPLSDRYGRRAPLLVGLAVYVIAAFAAVFSPTFSTLLVLRFVQGMGAAGTRVIATSLVRDRFGGRAMAEVMSLVFMVFMIIPVIAPAIGQVLLLTGPWEYIFLFMAALGLAITIWTFIRLPETLAPENRRALTVSVIVEGFRLVLTNRMAFSYGLAGMFVFGALFGFISTSQQIYVGIYGLGPYFPVAFAAIASLMAVASYTNSRIVRKIGMRRLSHGAMAIFIIMSGSWLVFALMGPMPLWLFFAHLAVIMFMFGWTMPNMNSLSMEPLGKVAGTASAVFGVIQTVGGALLGTFIGQMFDGSLVPIAAGYFVLGLIAMGCILIAENGKLFGVSDEYKDAPPPEMGH